ncbi:hypothetical protein LTR51_005907 [Lithohypha guttulata]|nr:hypothetical protein LTR51_005907 [Lithohypha guttulata]
MSFGFGVGDFLATFELATKVRDRWTDAPKEYKSIKDETKNVQNILRDIGELGTRIDLGKQHEADLRQACQSCREVLEEAEKLVSKYSSIQNTTSGRFKVRRAWVRLQVDPNDIRHLRDQLAAQITQLGLLYDVIETDLVINVYEGVQDLQHSDAQRERTIVADWYSSTDFANQQTDQLYQREPGTGRWFLGRSEYQQWRQQVNSTLLCPGIKGSGKSVMIATVINDLQGYFRESKDVVVAYLYCNFNRQAEQDLRSMLATLTRQLFQEKAQLPDAVTALYEKHRDRATRPSVEELKNVLRLLVSSCGCVFVVVDALDECGNTEKQRDNLLDELFSLQKSIHNNIHVLATTRFIPDIVNQFSGRPQLEIRAAEADIQVYLANRMNRLARFVSQDDQLQEEIKRQIVDAAEGMFLLARLQFDSLQDKTNRGHMKEALRHLKKGSTALDSEYAKTIDRIELQRPGWRDLARQTFMWITYATRQLSVDELCEAIAIDPTRPNFDLHDYLVDEDQIVSVCHGLIEIDQESRVVRLVHYTTQEYLEKIRTQWLPEGPGRITQSCLSYLSMDIFVHNQCQWHADLATTIRQHKFLEYAGKHWGMHARTVQHTEIRTDVVSFLMNADYLRFSTMVTLGNFNHDETYKCHSSDISAMHISAHFGLDRVIHNFVETAREINHKDSQSRTPLLYAIARGHTEVVQLLLAQPGIEVNTENKYGRSPLSEAAIRGHTKVVQLLLAQSDIEVNTQDEYGRSPLSGAASEGYTEVVQLLLARPGIEVNPNHKYGSTPLSEAARGGHTEIVRLLLARPGIEVNADTPLSRAASRGHTEVVQLLLAQPGIDVAWQDEYGNTPLSRAASEGYTEIVRLLLAQSDIEVNTQDEYGDVPLSEAASEGHTEVVRLLLAQPGIEVNTQDRYGKSPLSKAANGGYTEIVQLLLAQLAMTKDSQPIAELDEVL